MLILILLEVNHLHLVVSRTVQHVDVKFVYGAAYYVRNKFSGIDAPTMEQKMWQKLKDVNVVNNSRANNHQGMPWNIPFPPSCCSCHSAVTDHSTSAKSFWGYAESCTSSFELDASLSPILILIATGCITNSARHMFYRRCSRAKTHAAAAAAAEQKRMLICSSSVAAALWPSGYYCWSSK